MPAITSSSPPSTSIFTSVGGGRSRSSSATARTVVRDSASSWSPTLASRVHNRSRTTTISAVPLCAAAAAGSSSMVDRPLRRALAVIAAPQEASGSMATTRPRGPTSPAAASDK